MKPGTLGEGRDHNAGGQSEPHALVRPMAGAGSQSAGGFPAQSPTTLAKALTRETSLEREPPLELRCGRAATNALPEISIRGNENLRLKFSAERTYD